MSIVVEPRLPKFFILEGKEEVIPFVIKVIGVGSARSRSLYVVAIDSSWSMDGEKMFFAKRAVTDMLRLLDPEDYITVYSFCGTVRKVLELEKVGNYDRTYRAIAGIKLGGGTDIHRLLEHVYRDCSLLSGMDAEQRPSNVKMILMTDGNPTVGVRDEAKILALAERLGRHISISLVVGIGDDYNERLLAGIASKTNGVFEHLGDPSKMPAMVEKMASKYRRLSAKGVKLFMRTAPGIGVYIYNRPTYSIRGGVEVEVGDVYEGETVSVVGEFIVPPQRRGLVFLASVSASYIVHDGGTAEVPQKTLTVPCVHTVSPEDLEVDEGVFREANTVRMAMALARDLYGSVSADKLRVVIEELMNSTISVESRELYTRTLDLRTQLEREGLTQEAMKKVVALISRILSGRYG